MACCRTAPSHYLNQCWLLILEVLWHLPRSIFAACAEASILYNEFKNYTCTYRITATSRVSEWTHWGWNKMAAISRRHSEMDFLEWKCMNFDWSFTEVCSYGSNLQYSSIGLDNGLAPTRWQAIIWTNDGKFTDAYMRHSASMTFKGRFHTHILIYALKINTHHNHVLLSSFWN